jgi:hypothetical protein
MTALNTEHATYTAPSVTARARRRAFALHLGEMILAMVAGMVVLGGALEAVLAVAGASLSDAPAALAAAVMAFNMTAPMVWWMQYRGHPARHNAEMAGSMIVPTAIVIALHWLGLLPGEAVLAAQHVIMIPAMVGVMLWRYDHYAH